MAFGIRRSMIVSGTDLFANRVKLSLLAWPFRLFWCRPEAPVAAADPETWPKTSSGMML